MLESLPDGEYEVVIDSSRRDGALTYGECVLPGQVEDEFLISTHIWMLNRSDGNNSLLDIAERSGLPFGELRRATEISVEHGLLDECARRRQ